MYEMQPDTKALTPDTRLHLSPLSFQRGLVPYNYLERLEISLSSKKNLVSDRVWLLNFNTVFHFSHSRETFFVNVLIFLQRWQPQAGSI